MVKKYYPQKGDIIYINCSPQLGKEQAGFRPALTISSSLYNKKVGLGIFCPITKQIKGYPFEVLLPSYLKTKGVILVDQIKNFDWQKRSAKFIEKIPSSILEEVIEKLNLLVN